MTCTLYLHNEKKVSSGRRAFTLAAMKGSDYTMLVAFAAMILLLLDVGVSAQEDNDIDVRLLKYQNCNRRDSPQLFVVELETNV